MNYYSTRSKDYQIEQMVNEFEDKYFWPRKLGENLSCLTRYEDTYHQFGGVDFSLKGINFDEKVKYWDCLNKVQLWPGFEVSQRNKADNIQDGWLVAENLSTEWYSIVGLSTTVFNAKQLVEASQITAIDILWVKKQEVLDYITAYTPIEQIKADAQKLREDGDRKEKDEYGFWSSLPFPEDAKSNDGKYRKRYDHNMFQLTYSSRKKEQPINLVIGRSNLEHLKSTRHFVVTKDYVKDIVKEG